jgi:hypothetical protein
MHRAILQLNARDGCGYRRLRFVPIFPVRVLMRFSAVPFVNADVVGLVAFNQILGLPLEA